MILEILGKIPGSSSTDPPPIEDYQAVASSFLREKRPNDDQQLTAVKTVRDGDSRLLQFEWDQPRDQVENALSSVLLEAIQHLKTHQDHKLVRKDLLDLLQDLEKPWRIKEKRMPVVEGDVSNNETGMIATGFSRWKTANVKWLCNSTFFSPSCCPSMKVGANGVYENPEDYLDRIHKLWVAMTFCDGHGAFAPHCRSRGAIGGCGNALWPVAHGNAQASGNMRCRTRGCGNIVEFVCRIKSHDSVCASCASRSIEQHLMGPGTTASTHVYDCNVKRINSDGVIFLSDFRSRNPPPATIHWRTTKRLSVPNLVGIVRLSSNGLPLKELDLIKWGEIVFHGQSKDEDRYRQRGEVAVNISTIVDLDPDYFEEGSHIALIDCMTFVPEWIPVLKAIEAQKDIRLPFQNGQPLNLSKDNPTIFQSIVEGTTAEIIHQMDHSVLIDRLIEESQLEPICEIRRDASLRDELSSKLVRLVKATTLDKMQLISFVDGLRTPCHLVQVRYN